MNTITKQQEKINDFLLAGLKNLRQGLNSLSLDLFVLNTLEMLMLVERDEYLQKLKEDKVNDKGNGTYPRSFKSLSKNALVINIPRTRYSDFKPMALEILKYNQEQVNELVLKLYTKGLTTRDISDVLSSFFGEEISYAQVSNLAESFHKLRLAWEQSPLEPYYKVVYCDAIYMTLRRGNSYAKEPVHITYGVREDNKREVLDISLNPTETATSWQMFLCNLKERGVKQVDLFVADGLKGLEDSIHQEFPGADFQKCVIHKIRNVVNKVRPRDKAAVSEDLKEVFNNFESGSTKEEAEAKLEAFIRKWGKVYTSIKNSFSAKEQEYYFTYINYPPKVRRMIYTTNSLESLNKKLRKATKNKASFENADRLLDYIFVIVKEFEQNSWMKYPVAGFKDWPTKTQSN
jgi:transposase-like protein